METTKELKLLLAKIEKSKKIVAKERDELREMFGELDMLLESFDEAVDGLEEGKRSIESAIDTLSQYI